MFIRPFLSKHAKFLVFQMLQITAAISTARFFFLPPKPFQPIGNAMISRIKLEFQTKGATDHIPNVPNQGTFEEKMTNSFITPT
jgi:hypothetical protein